MKIKKILQATPNFQVLSEEDVYNAARLADYLPNMDLITGPVSLRVEHDPTYFSSMCRIANGSFQGIFVSLG
jgi:hypothetical protein